MAFFKPDRYFTRVTSIDAAELAASGVRFALLDLDNTLLPRDTHQVPEDIKAWLESVRTAGITPCILTNNWHHGAHEWAQRLGLPIVSHAVKPLPFAYIIALRKIGAKRKNTVCIGDQLITDVWGAHFMRMKVIMVNPLVKADLKHTLLLRHVEKLFTKGMQPEK